VKPNETTPPFGILEQLADTPAPTLSEKQLRIGTEHHTILLLELELELEYSHKHTVVFAYRTV
jgi:hypothetical protein